MKDNNEEILQMTPKGFLYTEIMQNPNDIQTIWENLIKFVEKRAKEEGMEGVPCLVLKGGGHCIAVEPIEHYPQEI